MSNLSKAWSEALPEIRNAVTGVGVWTALNTCKPILVDDGTLVMGLPHESTDLSGHLKMSHAKSLIERGMSARLGQPLTLRIIEGITEADWETVKKRDVEARRLQDQALTRQRAEIQARSSWETIYEQLNRKYASISNKSLPQNRARFFREALDLVIEHKKAQPVTDDLAERNYARCLERIAQYTELPSALVALTVIDRMGE